MGGQPERRIDRYDRETDRFVRHRLKGLSDVSRIVLDKQNQLLLGTMKDGLFSFNPYMEPASRCFWIPGTRICSCGLSLSATAGKLWSGLKTAYTYMTV